MTAPATFSRTWWAGVLPVPTRRLALAVVLVAPVALVVPSAAGAVVVVLLAAVVDAYRAPHPWTVTVVREVPRVISLGATAQLTWRVRHDASREVALELADELVPSLRAEARRVAMTVPPGASAAATTTLAPTRRGRFVPGALTVRVQGPLGLATRQVTRAAPGGTIEVHPRFRSRREAELRITRGRILDVGLRAARALGRGTEFEALRDYTPDDEFRRVDWAATARVGRPIVRTYRSERNQTVLVLLDTGRLMAGLVDEVPRIDHAMDATMALTTVATHLGDRAGLVAFSADVRATVPPQGDRQQLGRVTQALFDLEPDLTESAYDEVFAATVARYRRRTLLVVLTELASEALVQTLVPALPMLLRHHLVVVAAVRDPELERWRTESPANTDAAYRTAGAVTVDRARRRTAALLRRLGAQVVDEPPDRLAGRLADTYLDLKSTGRL